MKLEDIISIMEDWADEASQEEWDNSGLQLGDRKADISKVLVSLDADPETISKASRESFDLVLSHHPLIFDPLKSIDAASYHGSIITKAIKNDINIYAAHTNLDKAMGGVNDALAEKLGYDLTEPLFDDETSTGFARYGEIEEISLKDLKARVDKRLGARSLVYSKGDKLIKSLAVSGGSGAFALERVVELGLDAIVTGDIKYHDYQEAIFYGLAIIDPGHYATEAVVVEKIKSYLEEKTDLYVESFYTGDHRNF